MRAVDVVVVPTAAASTDDALGDPAAGSSASASRSVDAAPPLVRSVVACPAPAAAAKYLVGTSYLEVLAK